MSSDQHVGGGNGSVCPRCGGAFTCGMLAGETPCWCARLPDLRERPPQWQTCLCPDCLKDLLAGEQR